MSHPKRRFKPEWLTPFLFVALALPAPAASSWRFWTKADGLSESVVFGLTPDAAGRILVKSGDVPDINVLDGYQISAIPSLHAFGRLIGSSDNEIWTFDAEGIDVRDSSGWHRYADREIAEFARTSSMARTSWFMYSVTRDAADRMDVVPLGKGSGLIMFPDRLVEWNRRTGKRRVVRVAAQTSLVRFRDIQKAWDGGYWLTDAGGIAHLKARDGDFEWRETRAPGRVSDLVSPIEGPDEELFVSACCPAYRAAQGKRFTLVAKTG
jgi:hypothetical protein